MIGMTVAEEQEAKKQWRKARKSFTNKEHLTLMKSVHLNDLKAVGVIGVVGIVGVVRVHHNYQDRLGI
jgi:hypothetical protein